MKWRKLGSAAHRYKSKQIEWKIKSPQYQFAWHLFYRLFVRREEAATIIANHQDIQVYMVKSKKIGWKIEAKFFFGLRN